MHGYKKRRSIVTNAVCHKGKACIAKYDIKNFFPSIHHVRVNKIFLKMNFSQGEANLLTRLTTVHGCLPHGFLTSPKIALITLINVDKRLKGAFKKIDLAYTFYSDDVTISGNINVKKFENLVIKIFKQEGFTINKDKIYYYKYYERQEVTGVVVNNKLLNVPSKQRESIKAVLYNCFKLGPRTQINRYWQDFGEVKSEEKNLSTFKARLFGRINYVRSINRQSANKLMTIFRQIDWS